MRWIQRLLRRSSLESQMERELEFHREQQVHDYIAAGLSPGEARRRVHIDFGGSDQIKEECRDARGTRWLEDLASDTRYGLRAMRKNPGFTTVAVLSLALGIGANTAIFSLIDTILLRMLPVQHPEQLTVMRTDTKGESGVRFSYPQFARYHQGIGPRADLAAMSSTLALNCIIGAAQPEIANAQLVSGNWFDLLGVRPALGRTLSPQDERTIGGNPVAVLSNAFWQRRFGSNPSALNQSIILNGTAFTVIGIAPRGFFGFSVGDSPDLWIPSGFQSQVRYAGNASADDANLEKPWGPQDGIRWLMLVARIPEMNRKPAIEAQWSAMFHHDMEQVAAKANDPLRRQRLRANRLHLDPAPSGVSDLRQSFSAPLWVLMAAVAAVLLIACANLANLLLARGTARAREIAVRLSMGAGRGRIIRQLLTESMLLAIFGGALSLLIAQWGTQLLLRMAGGSKPIPLDTGLDYRVLAFTAFVSLATGLLFGFAPAFRLTRIEPGAVLKANTRIVGSSARGAFGKALVSLQVAFSLVLLIGAVLFIRTLQNLASVDPGFEREHLLTALIDIRAAGYHEDDLPAFYQRLLDRVRSLPGVQSASLSLYSMDSGSARISGINVPGHPQPPGEEMLAQENHVSSDYFATVGIPIRAGRAFTAHDTKGAPKVAIVTESFARMFYGNENPLGRRFGYDPTDAAFQVVGLVPDIRVNDLRSTPPPLIFYPLEQAQGEFIRSIDIRATGDPHQIASEVRSALAQLDPNLPVRRIITLKEQVERTLTDEKLVARLTGIFGLLAVALACIGLFGVMSYSVARRTSELGIRFALGASQAAVLWLVLKETVLLTGAGLLGGLILALASMRLVQSLLYGLSPADPATMCIATAALICAATIASLLPAWKAARIDPATALRDE